MLLKNESQAPKHVYGLYYFRYCGIWNTLIFDSILFLFQVRRRIAQLKVNSYPSKALLMRILVLDAIVRSVVYVVFTLPWFNVIKGHGKFKQTFHSTYLWYKCIILQQLYPQNRFTCDKRGRSLFVLICKRTVLRWQKINWSTAPVKIVYQRHMPTNYRCKQRLFNMIFTQIIRDSYVNNALNWAIQV